MRETFKLLTLASARDGRTVDQAVAAIWADDLEHIRFDDAVRALKSHYQESTDWIMPAHIIKLVRKLDPVYALTMSPVAPKDCGNHRRMPDGTCLHCEVRPDGDNG